jgi:hypothetical protein
VSAPGLLRVTVVSDSRRADLAVPGVVPVAELLPELARSLGLLDAALVHGGFRVVTAEGRELVGDSDLLAQGVADGALLLVTAGVATTQPRIYDDVVEAMADVIQRDLHAWSSAAARRAAVMAAALMMALGAVALLRGASNHLVTTHVATGAGAVIAGSVCVVGIGEWRLLALSPVLAGTIVVAGGLLAGSAGLDPAVVLTSVLTAAVLAGGAFPSVALGLTGTRVDELVSSADITAPPPARIDPARVGADARLAHQILLATSAAVGLLLVLIAPLAVTLGIAGTLLAAACCLALLLRTRGPAGTDQIAVDLVSGLLGVTSVAVSVIWMHPAWRPATSVTLTAAGGALLVRRLVTRLPALRLARLLDVAEACCLLALPPLLVLATGLFSTVAD